MLKVDEETSLCKKNNLCLETSELIVTIERCCFFLKWPTQIVNMFCSILSWIKPTLSARSPCPLLPRHPAGCGGQDMAASTGGGGAPQGRVRGAGEAGGSSGLSAVEVRKLDIIHGVTFKFKF